MEIDELPVVTCKRCGHEWVPRVLPVVQCAKCRTARWNEERKPKTKPRRSKVA